MKKSTDFDELSELFELEPEDLRELEHMESTIEQGGTIFFALDEDGTVMACCMVGPGRTATGRS